jgi:hypothetical protein
MWQGSSQSIKLPNNKHITSLHERQCLRQAMSVINRAGDMIFKQVTTIDPSGQQGITLQVGGLPVRLR